MLNLAHVIFRSGLEDPQGTVLLGLHRLDFQLGQSAALLLGHSLFVFQAVDLLVDFDLGLRLDWVEKSLFFGVPFELRHIVAHTSSKPKAATRAHKAPLVEHDEI